MINTWFFHEYLGLFPFNFSLSCVCVTDRQTPAGIVDLHWRLRKHEMLVSVDKNECIYILQTTVSPYYGLFNVSENGHVFHWFETWIYFQQSVALTEPLQQFASVEYLYLVLIYFDSVMIKCKTDYSEVKPGSVQVHWD